MSEEMSAAPVVEAPVTETIEPVVESKVELEGGEKPAAEAKPAAALSPAEVASKYKALTRKLKENPNFKFTDEDSAVYDAHLKIKHGPSAKTTEEVPEVIDTDEDEEVGTDGTAEGELTSEVDPNAPVIDPAIAPLMEKFGAKTPEELAAAVESVQGQAQEYFDDNRQMLDKINYQEKSMNAAHTILMGVIAGNPAAIETARNIARQSGAKIPGLAVDLNTIQDPNTRQALLVLQQENEALKAQHSKVLNAHEQHTQRIQQETAAKAAQTQVTHEVTNLASKFPALGLSPAEAHTSLQEFFSTGKVPAKLAPLMSIVQFADSKGYSLEDAAKIMAYEQIPTMVQQAQVQGRQGLLKQQPSRTLAGQEGRSGEFREFTRDQVRAMFDSDMSGKSTYPAAWTEGGVYRSHKAPKYVNSMINEFLSKPR